MISLVRCANAQTLEKLLCTCLSLSFCNWTSIAVLNNLVWWRREKKTQHTSVQLYKMNIIFNQRIKMVGLCDLVSPMHWQYRPHLCAVCCIPPTKMDCLKWMSAVSLVHSFTQFQYHYNVTMFNVCSHTHSNTNTRTRCVHFWCCKLWHC